MAKKVGTDRPTGLKIERDGLKFTFGWKKGETYGDGQQLQYKLYIAKSQEIADSGRNFLSQGFEIEGTKWISVSIGKTAKDKSITLSASDFYPTSGKPVLYGIAFRVRGQADEYSKTKKGKTTHYDPQWSAWVTKTMVIRKPDAPTLTVEDFDPNYVNRSTYTWATESNAKNSRPVTNVEYQTIVKQDCPANVKGLAEWDSATSTTKTLNDSNYHDETGLSNVSKTRVVRVRSRGVGGYSSWQYAKHIFAAPYAALISTYKTVYNSTTHVWNLAAVWDTPQDAGHPVDFYTLQYRIGKPGANMSVTSDGSWTDCGNTTAGDIAEQVTDQIDNDECLWLRVAASHDNHTGANAVFGTAVLAYIGKVAAPSNLSITASDVSSRTVTISVKNNSQISDSKVAIVFQPTSNPAASVAVAVLTGSGTISQSGIKCPDWSNSGTLGFKAYAYVGTESYTTDADSVKRYNIVPAMMSDPVFTSGGIPKAPAVMTANKSGHDIEVNWEWTWEAANGAEVSWATKPNAWESTDAPDTHIVSTTGPSHLFIADVEMGKTYYVRVRLLYDDGEEITYGPYSGTQIVYMTEAPLKPVLDVSTDAIKQDEELTCSWTYTSADGTPQVYAAVFEYTGGAYVKLAETTTAQHVTFTPKWTAGTQHNLYVKTTSESGLDSPYSDKVTVTAVTPPTCTITQTNLVAAGTGYELQSLPLTITVTGAGTAGQTLLEIIRADDFVQRMPDDTLFNGFAGQQVTRRLYAGQAQQTITLADVVPGTLNDTALYKIVAVITDGYGQTAKAALDFTVAWSQQPVAPQETNVTVAFNDTAAYLSFTKPAGAANTDTLDIYRLSADPPELIYEDAAFTDVIVDPFPVVGDYGGYRVVLKTSNGDIYDADMNPAWVDIDAGLDVIYQYIDFNGYTLPLALNVNLDSAWAKRFKKTVYLGGNEEGDWLEGYDRTGGVASVLLTEEDTDDIRTLRRLARYAGPAHVRTKDGSSYNANVQVSNENLDSVTGGMFRSLTLNIEATQRAVLDGLPQAEWEAQ